MTFACGGGGGGGGGVGVMTFLNANSVKSIDNLF